MASRAERAEKGRHKTACGQTARPQRGQHRRLATRGSEDRNSLFERRGARESGRFSNRQLCSPAAMADGSSAPLTFAGAPPLQPCSRAAAARRSPPHPPAFLEKMRNPAASDIVKAIKSFLNEFGSSPPAGDRDGERVQAFLSTTEAVFRTHPLWRGVGEEELEASGEGLEKYLLTKLHARTFAVVAEDVERDAVSALPSSRAPARLAPHGAAAQGAAAAAPRVAGRAAARIRSRRRVDSSAAARAPTHPPRSLAAAGPAV